MMNLMAVTRLRPNVTLSGAPPMAHDVEQRRNRRVRSSKS
jgi:hypothetical protein